MIDARDNTATLLAAVEAGGTARVRAADDTVFSVVLREAVGFAHKCAVRAIAAGDPVIKYGEVIGTAVTDIAVGDWVHVHNVEAIRGRGDVQAQAGESPNVCADSEPEAGYPQGALTGEPVLDAAGTTFMGYPRPDGQAGTRNLVGIISCVVCANDVVSKLGEIEGAAGFTHQQGCSQTRPDVQTVSDVLVNLAANPNLGAVLYVSLGCESVPSREVSERACAFGKPVRLVVIQEEGGLTKTLEKARGIVEELRETIAAERVPVPID